jgi:type I restriction enzyme S subunit
LLREVDVGAGELGVAESDQVPVLSLTKDFGLIPQSERFDKRIAVADIRRYKVLKKGQIVYNPCVVWEGAVYALRDREAGLVSPVYFVWEAAYANAYYLDYLLRTPRLLSTYIRLCSGTVKRRRSLRKTAFREIVVALPPLDEQRRIACVFSTIQGTIKAQEKVIAAARELKRSLMKHLFTYGPVPISETSRVCLKETEIGPVPTHWEVIRLGEVCAFLQYGTSSRCGADQSGLPVLRIPNVVGCRVDTSDMKFIHLERRQADRIMLKPGDLLFVRTNATRENVGRCAVFRGEPMGALFASYLIRVQLRDGTIIPDFMHMYAVSEGGRRYLSGMASGAADGKFNINTQTIRAVIVPYPPSGEQRQIVNVVQAVDGKIDAKERRKDALQALFKTMLHHLMTGKIRVKDL